ncbi:MAG: hypothetical protein QG670_140 [Thermoproteota archaeon]|nr:hypothetical protein [Thermoproteota archaeon]
MILLQSFIIVRNFEEILLFSAISVFLSAFILIIFYFRKILKLKKEYVEAKNVIGSIVLSFKRHQDDQDKRIVNINSDMENINSSIEKLTGQNRLVEGKISNLIKSLKAAFTVNKNLIEHITTMQDEINDLSKTQQGIQKQFIDLDEKYHQIPVTTNITVKDETPLEVKLTETEEQIIQSLLTQGPKTAPQIEEMIGKTREHTARLMKKLWQEGFIERDTHKIPFVYRANEKLKEKLEAKG